MKCKKCKVSMFKMPLIRTNPKGQTDAGWMCQDCIKKYEPELYRNLQEKDEFSIANEIMKIIKES